MYLDPKKFVMFRFILFLSYNRRDIMDVTIHGIDVIAMFNDQGEIRPLYAKIKGYGTIKIEGVISVDDAPFTGRGNVLEFVCEYVLKNMTNMFKLRYHVKEHMWSAPGLQENGE